MWHLIVGLTVIALGAIFVLYFGIRFIEAGADDPIEHGDGEPDGDDANPTVITTRVELDAYLARLEHGEPGP